MTARDFPEITPSSRTYKPGTLPKTVFTGQNGATTFIQFGNTFVNAELSLSFGISATVKPPPSLLITHQSLVMTTCSLALIGA